MAAPGLLAYVLVSKFCDALPFYRQEKIFARQKVELGRATMCNWAVALSRRLARLRDLLHVEVRAGPCIGIDETPVQVLKEPDRKATQKSYMWVMRGGETDRPVVTYEYRTTREGSFLKELLADIVGTVMSDGYVVYDALASLPDVNLVNCWAHARRGFFKAHELSKSSEGPAHALELIRRLYRIEDDIRDLAARKKKKRRQREAKPILAELKEYLTQESIAVAGSTQYGRAIAYTLDRWERLIAYADTGDIPIDNNDCEQLMKRVATGRKNWLFKGSLASGERAANLMTIIGSAIRNDLDVHAYLEDVLRRSLSGETDWASMAPHVWKQEHPESIRKYRQEERRQAADRKRVRRARRRKLKR